MKKRFFLMLLIGLGFVTCSSGNRISGHVENASGERSANALVRLVSVDDSGNELFEIDSTIANSNGEFEFDVPNDAPSSVLVRAELSSGALRAFALEDVVVSPISDALVSAVLQVTASEGGRTLDDFAPEELEAITQTVDENLDPVTVDLTDASSLILAVIAAAGRSIPDAAGGAITGLSSSAIEPPDVITVGPTLINSPPPCGRYAYPVQGNLFEFQLKEDGGLCDAVGGVLTPLYSSYDIGFELSVVGDTFVDSSVQATFFPGDNHGGVPSRSVEDDREFVFGPATTASGITLTRKVYIPEGSDYARYLEIWNNPTADSKSITFQLTGELSLGTPLTPPIVLVDDSADRTAAESDDWAVFQSVEPSSLNPSVGVVWNGTNALSRADSVLFPPDNANAFLIRWTDVPLAAGETKTFVTFTRILTTVVAEDARDTVESLYGSPDLEGMNFTELNGLQNVQSNRGNLVGEAGSVVSGTAVEVTVGSDTTTGTAAADGSFVLLVNADSGDTATITTGDGWSTTVAIP